MENIEEEHLGLGSTDPEWLHRLDNGNIKVNTKEGDYELTDVAYKKLIKARQKKGYEDVAAISLALVEPKLTETEVMNLKSSTVTRIQKAIMELMDLDSFL